MKFKTTLSRSLKQDLGLIKVDIHFNFLLRYSLPSQDLKYFVWSFQWKIKLVTPKLKSKHHFENMQLPLKFEKCVMKSYFKTWYVPKLLAFSLFLVLVSVVWSNLCYSLWCRESALSVLFTIYISSFQKLMACIIWELGRN